MISAPMSGPFRFGEFELDPAAYVLRRGHERIKLEKIPMDVLILLVESADAVVPRDAIQAALWDKDVFVEHDSAINTAIRKVRRALGDDFEAPRFVETIVGKGYRFIAAVERSRRGPSGRLQKIDVAFPRYCVTRGKQEFILQVGQNVLGRDPDVHVHIDHPSVSRRHARISAGPDGAVLDDLESRNGTFVDGRRVDAPSQLRHGATIGLGAITLTFLVLSEPASTKPISGTL
jgi:DNA-binding winged helix-turn-helix (wHTH) protein